MLETLKSELAEGTSRDAYVSDMLDRVMAIRPTARVERMREAYFDGEGTFSIDRARIETRVMKETEGEPEVTRRARIFAAVVREMPIDIYPDELFAGCTSVRPHCTNITPIYQPLSTAGITNRALVGTREAETDYTDDMTREMEELTRYWKEQGRVPGWPLNLSHYGHNLQNFEKVLKKGFVGIRKDAEERLARLDLTNPDEFRKVAFLEGVIMSMDAASEIGKRYAARARELAEKEADSTRKAELLKIAEVCEWVPANPARTFYEALQSLYFAFMLLYWELPYISHNQGRLDQYLYPYYESDVREGRTTQEAAQELCDCYFLKLSQGPGACTTNVGGVKADGSDATNALSYMFIESMMHTRFTTPWLGVLIHSKTPDDLIVKACQLSSLGTGHPQFLNSDVMVAQCLARGDLGGPLVTLEDARSAATMGCVEPIIPGKDSGYLFYNTANVASAMHDMLTSPENQTNRGKIPKWGIEALETSDPRQFTSFEDVQEAFQKVVAWQRRNSQSMGARNEMIVMQTPTVYESALIDDCIEKGICREEGGAHYNWTATGGLLGSSDAGDSLAVIKKLVFEEKKITMAELCDALDSDFEGYEDIRKMCLEVPKFGNDEDYVDKQVAWVMHQWVDEFKKLKNLRGGYCIPGGSPMAMHVPYGKVVGALPSGRLAGEPLCDASSPSAGNDLSGLTAVLKSSGKIDHTEIHGGAVLNLRIDPAAFKGGDMRRMIDLVRAFIDQKVFHMQINVVSSDTLKAAQKVPGQYRDLVVKVAGYNAFFTELTDELQESIIVRTEHGL